MAQDLVQIALRVDRETARVLREIAEKSYTNSATIARQILMEGLEKRGAIVGK